jgi:cell wall-associated NlpC family hydrolase
MPLVAQLLIALGVDARWVFGVVIGLIVGTLLVVIIVIESVATVLTGAYARPPAPATSEATSSVLPPQLSTGGSLPAPATTTVPENADLAARVVELAQSWLGVPYAFGGCSHAGVDCSCLVQNVYAALGIRLPRVAVDQFNATSPVADA